MTAKPSPPLFRTVVPLPHVAHAPLRHDAQLTLLGSCFSEGVGAWLSDAGHSTLVNPTGTIYNPTSLARAIALFARDERLGEDDVHYCERQRHWYSFDAGTVHCHEDQDACLSSLNEAIDQGRESLECSAALFLTLGTAWAYERVADGAVVANNHRQPHADFERRLLSIPEIEASLLSAAEAARALNPSLRVVLTTSPVRHWREGAVASSRSKAHLLAAAHGACERSGGGIEYFPSYEIVLDELRDYRWFRDDMLHPTDAAVDYVAQRLCAAYFDPADEPLRAAVRKLRASGRHRHMRPQSAAAKAFARAQLDEVERLRAESPHVIELLGAELTHFRGLLEA